MEKMSNRQSGSNKVAEHNARQSEEGQKIRRYSPGLGLALDLKMKPDKGPKQVGHRRIRIGLRGIENG